MTKPSNEDLLRWAEEAEEATPGPWTADKAYLLKGITDIAMCHPVTGGPAVDSQEQKCANARHIANAAPDTFAAMCRELVQKRQIIDAMSAVAGGALRLSVKERSEEVAEAWTAELRQLVEDGGLDDLTIDEMVRER